MEPVVIFAANASKMEEQSQAFMEATMSAAAGASEAAREASAGFAAQACNGPLAGPWGHSPKGSRKILKEMKIIFWKK